MVEAGASNTPGGSTNPEGSDVDPGLAQDRDMSESVTNPRDVNGNGRNTHANVLWNNQYALLADYSRMKQMETDRCFASKTQSHG